MFKKILKVLACLLIPLFIIFYGGFYLQDYLNTKYKNEINKNGVIKKAIVYRKNTHKGKFVYFKYAFKNKSYDNKEKSVDFFDALNVGDTINILLDSTDADKSYILK